MAAKQEFASRFAKHKDELEWLFMELYHNREGLEVLEREMAEAYNARSAELKALDKARSADPEWYKRGNMFGMTMNSARCQVLDNFFQISLLSVVFGRVRPIQGRTLFLFCL